jgi:hypothetical protein
MAYRDSTTAGGVSASPSVAVPTGVASDDIVLLVASLDGGGAGSVTWPTGFTELANSVLSGPDGQRGSFAWKRLTGADSGTYDCTFTFSTNWLLQAFAFSGRHTTDPPVKGTLGSSTASNSSPVTITANGVTAVAGDDLLWVSVPDVTVNSAGTGHTPPTDFTEAEDAEQAWSNSSGAYRANVSAGATGDIAGTFTMTSGGAGWLTWLIRIPAAAAGMTPVPGTPAYLILRLRPIPLSYQ